MAQIDIPVGPKLQEALDIPPCADLSLPQPSPTVIHLPTGGGTISAINDLSRGIPTDCSMSFSLMLQLSPLLAALECPMKILKVIEPVVEILTGSLPPTPALVEKLVKAAADLAPCFLALTPAGMLPFVKDILELISKLLKCLVGQLKTLIGLMSGLQLRLADAESAGNDDLMNTLQCAQDNANASAASLKQSIEPVSALLAMMKPFFGIAQIDAIEIPAIGDESDAEALNGIVVVLEDVIAAIDVVLEAV